MYKIQYNAIVDEFKLRAKLMERYGDGGSVHARYLADTVEMLTEPMPEDADQMIERTVEVQQFASGAMRRMRQMYAISGDEDFRDRAETLTMIGFGLAMGRAVAMSLIGVEEI